MANLLLVDDDPDLLPDQMRQVFPAPAHRVEIAPTGGLSIEASVNFTGTTVLMKGTADWTGGDIGLGSSVTSKRIMGHCRRAAASSAPVPERPVQLHSDRRAPGSTGCVVQCRLTGAVRTRAIAHSTCWHTASGVEWTYTTPHVGTVTSRRPRCVFPYDLDRG